VFIIVSPSKRALAKTFLLTILQTGIVEAELSGAQIKDFIMKAMETSGHAAFIRNMSFVLHERLAFSAYLASSPQEAELDFHDKEDWQLLGSKHPQLLEARCQLISYMAQRTRELQLLADWPLVRPRRSALQLEALRRTVGTCDPWEQIGERGSVLLELPQLPGLVRREVLGPMELLLVMAGQLDKDVEVLSQASTAGGLRGSPLPGYGSCWARLPRSLGMVTFLPALRTLKVPTLDWLRSFFADLRPQQRHVGLDDRQQPWFKEVKVAAGRALIQENSIPLCRSFLRFGAPHGLRAKIWECTLGLGKLQPEDTAVFAALCTDVQTQQTLMDVCLEEDVQAVVDSEHFFLFEEMLRSVVLAFLRDMRVPRHCSVEPHPRPVDLAAAVATSVASSTGRQPAGTPYLPTSIVPGRGLALLAAPLCYMYSSPDAVYRMFRAMYCRYWCKLYTLSTCSSPSPALPTLIKTFETLLQELDPEVVAHIHGLGMPVASIALPWICGAFVAQLPVEEVLLLWDRVLGLDSLLPLPLLAVAVVCFRRQVILSCQSGQEVVETMSDITQLKTVPLLQAVLFQA